MSESVLHLLLSSSHSHQTQCTSSASPVKGTLGMPVTFMWCAVLGVQVIMQSLHDFCNLKCMRHVRAWRQS